MWHKKAYIQLRSNLSTNVLPEPEVAAEGCNHSSPEAERQEEVQGQPGIYVVSLGQPVLNSKTLSPKIKPSGWASG